MIKAIFFDIDGTLVSHTKRDIPEGVLTALDELRAKGILLFIASGRHISEFPALPLHDYPFDGYVTQTGQICYNGAFETIYEQPFTDEDTESLVRMFNEREIPIVLLNDRSLYINFVNEYVVRTQNAINTPIPPIDSYHGEKLYGATVFGESATIDRVEERLTASRATRWNRFAADIVLGEAGKENGIRKMLDHYGISRDEIMAFGDADNDLDMISFAGIGVVMGNGTEKMKAIADYVTASVDEGGVVEALRHFGLIE
jgi:Cof subfamily protein (haloacid dehalogenase superfamily)